VLKPGSKLLPPGYGVNLVQLCRAPFAEKSVGRFWRPETARYVGFKARKNGSKNYRSRQKPVKAKQSLF